MFSLCTGLKALQIVRYAIIYALIVASFKVQTVEIFVAAPIAPEQGIAAFKHYGACDTYALVFCEHYDDIVSHGFTHFAEELYIKRWCAPFSIERIQIEANDIAPVFFFQFSTMVHR